MADEIVALKCMITNLFLSPLGEKGNTQYA